LSVDFVFMALMGFSFDSGNSNVWEQHRCLQVCPRSSLLCYRWWLWKRAYLSYSSSGFFWFCGAPAQVAVLN